MTCDEEVALETLNRSIEQFLCDIEGVIAKYPKENPNHLSLLYAKTHGLRAQELVNKTLIGEYEND